MPTAVSIVFVGLTIFLSHYFAALFLLRIPIVRLSVPRDTSLKDAAFMAVIIPKGLGAAVLASLPLQKGVPGGEIIQSTVFSIILCSTLFTTVLTFLVDKTPVSRLYEWVFRFSGLGRPVENVPPEKPVRAKRPVRPRAERKSPPPSAD